MEVNSEMGLSLGEMPTLSFAPEAVSTGIGEFSLAAEPPTNAPAGAAPASSAAASSGTGDPQPLVYGKIPDEPTQEAIEGIRFDFNDGIRIRFPNTGYRVMFSDIDTGVILYNNEIAAHGTLVTSVKKFFVRFRLQIFRAGKNQTEPIFTHDFNAEGKEVMIQLPVGTIGDSIGWFSYVERFQKAHNCKVICVMTPWIAEMFKAQYPDIKFITNEETLNHPTYACYYLGLFFKGNDSHQPSDFRYVGLHRTAGYILGVDPADEPPRLKAPGPRKIQEPYVCIAAQSSSQAKYWNNPNGWRELVKFLKDSGYRVLCIDKAPVHGGGIVWNQLPYGVEDFTGDKPLQERIDLLQHADFFIGLSSGLAWLAWCCKIPVVMISGFTHPLNEFTTPYRVINFHVCNSCWNDMRVEFDHFDFLWCPRHKGTDRHFECTRLITPEQVKSAIKRIPAFKRLQEGGKAASGEHVEAEFKLPQGHGLPSL